MWMRTKLAGAMALALTAGLANAKTGPIQQCGTASWYELTSMTANGETANPDGLTAAHKSLPFGTLVRVVNLDNGRALTLRINDRGPYISGRIIDVTREAANRLGFKDQGTVRVRVAAAGEEPQSVTRRCF